MSENVFIPTLLNPLMSTRQAEVRDLQEGSYVMMDDEPCEIDSYTTAKPGKHGSAKARVEATGVFDERKRSFSQPVDASIRVPVIDRKQGQVVSIDEDEVQVMDLDTYDTFRIKVDEHSHQPDDTLEFIEYGKRRRMC